jgi:hypothetical protein
MRFVRERSFLRLMLSDLTRVEETLSQPNLLLSD